MNSDQPPRGRGGSPITFDRARTASQTTADGTRSRQRDPAPEEKGDEWENPYAYTIEKPHTSAIRYDRAVPPRRSALPENPKKTRRIRQRHPDRSTLVIWLCLAIIVMVGGWWLLSTIGNWWQGVQENWQYGFPRTAQADQYVGLGDSPAHPDHFIALNLHGVIEVIQLNPSDRAKDAVYVLASVGNDSTPASLSFRDTTGSGRTDVIVTIGDSTPYTIVLINNGKTLVPTQPAH